MELLFKFFLLILISIFSLNASTLSEDEIKKLIGRTIILGFNGKTINKSLKNDIKKYNLGGVILFDKYYKSKKIKNIKNPKQLKNLIQSIQKTSNYKMFISIDQEGGWVSRLSSKNGFSKTEKASYISKKGITFAKKSYKNLAQELNEVGINLNFAPVVDLSINPKNRVIVYQGRSYSKNTNEVVKYSKIFINELNKQNVFSVLKHFPGHGSSLEDSHEGFVDITKTWQKDELLPYKKLIKTNHAKIIMTAHVFNKKLDKNYPATLSKEINKNLLRDRLNFKGLIVSDDLQMKAITSHYTLKKTLELSINSGVNILLFGNQIDNQNVQLKTIVDTIYELILNKKVDIKDIIKSNKLIKNLFIN